MRIPVIGLLVLLHSFVFAQVSKMPDVVCGINNKNSREDYVRVQQTIYSLQKLGRLQFKKEDIEAVSLMKTLQPSAPTFIRFAWPLTSRKSEEYAYLTSKNFIDLDTSECGMIDYNGGKHTYNGHNGMDIGIGPYGWQRQKDNDVYAIAAAPGIIVGKRDGGFDGNCSWTNPPWVGASASGNFVAVLHADGQTVSYYKHLKNGSLTQKDSGDYVSTGEYLGVIASSGRSTGPHLHFEVHVDWGDPDRPEGKLIEPFAGPYNPDTNVSLWINQPPYEEPDIMGIESHNSGTMDMYTGSCDSSINLNTLDNSFAPGTTVYFRTFFRDWTDGSQVNFYLVKPDGSAETTWTPQSNGSESGYLCSSYGPEPYRFSYYIRSKALPLDAPAGTWAFRFSYYGKTYSHYFAVGCLLTESFSGTQSGTKGFLVSNRITSTATISGNSTNNIQYRADNEVILSPGFTATAGCQFVANNKGCNRVN
jgi:murein DD-endopeptidase MepM/ murein hydrolase activator NlpD